uniref:Uncharacterized protein n=1 Tax=Rhizophora mucronata TaxID=61149 RepID=A0A2P2PN67_RHIMU
MTQVLLFVHSELQVLQTVHHIYRVQYYYKIIMASTYKKETGNVIYRC